MAPGIYRSVTDEVAAWSLRGSSLYDSARVKLDRLIANGAFCVGDYEAVRDELVYANVPSRWLNDAREDLIARMETATFHLTVDVDPETGGRQIVVVARAAVSPQDAARVAWDFYGEWLAKQPSAFTAAVSFDVRPDVAQ